MSQIPLQLENIRKTFQDGDKEVDIIKSLSFEAKKGELVAVVGPSGSGKSTFLSIAGALLSPDGGRVIVNGADIAQFSEKERADVRLRAIGFIFQSANLVPFLKVKDQLKMVKELATKWGREAKEEAQQLLQSVGLEHRMNHYPHQLSGGERQRVAIARAFMNDPDIILADEPTASLDGKRSKEIVELLANEAKDKNKAAIIVTHDEAVLPFCDRIYMMDNGRLILKEEMI
ncbi:ABC transporter ATP-binding protein [Fervidibacillus halotolerans]|uniref:Putative hemin import ATP-binding protein HrtA n=1 Tax=Fervidibacillus halotolerans TaxID=2980027 RepID=A0A9E8RYU8_9BACI|nr:ABC transporter ATP-binding protein [Fervidibacillus halotolerans]WAA12633.1 ABC transporter ATP-binding protein [Fervidibacillus halotolerans]